MSTDELKEQFLSAGAFIVGEDYVIGRYRFECVGINGDLILFKSVGPLDDNEETCECSRETKRLEGEVVELKKRLEESEVLLLAAESEDTINF
jgi:hypothetical protein